MRCGGRVKRNFRKPLVIMTPKSLLRHKLAGVAGGRHDGGQPVSHRHRRNRRYRGTWRDHARHHLLGARCITICWRNGGTAAYATSPSCGWSRSIRSRSGPWRSRSRGYKRAQIVWCQEEPENMGAWSFVRSPYRARIDGPLNIAPSDRSMQGVQPPRARPRVSHGCTRPSRRRWCWRRSALSQLAPIEVCAAGRGAWKDLGCRPT